MKRPEAGRLCLASGLRSSRCLMNNPRHGPYNSSGRLHWCNVFCLWTFLALAHCHHYFLAFAQGFATAGINSAEVNKNILTAITFDESESLFIVEPFNGAFYLL